jgi:ribosomal protein S18 acetylase RimI-like enzyme
MRAGMTHDLHFRRAVAADAERLGELGGQLVRMHQAVDPRRFFVEPGVERGYARWLGGELQRDTAVVLVAEAGGEIVGYAYATLEGRDWNMLLDDHAALRDVFVAEGRRRQGVGGHLLDAMLAELERLGATRIVLSTMTGNEEAKRLFASRCFRPTMLEMTRGPGA